MGSPAAKPRVAAPRQDSLQQQRRRRPRRVELLHHQDELRREEVVLISMASRARTSPSQRLARSAIGGIFFLITRYAELLRTRVSCGLAQKKNQDFYDNLENEKIKKQ